MATNEENKMIRSESEKKEEPQENMQENTKKKNKGKQAH